MIFIDVNKHFWSLEAINYLVAYIHFESKVKFQLEVSENRVVIFYPPSKFTDSLRVRGPQVKNSLQFDIRSKMGGCHSVNVRQT